MKKYFLISLSLLLLFLSPISRADVDSRPSDQSVTKLVNIMMDKDVLDQMYLSIMPSIRAMQEEIIANAGVPMDEELSQILKKNMDAALADTKAYVLGSKYETLMISTYKNTFTQKEIDALYQFMSSPEGKSYYQKMPTLMQQIMGAFQTDLMPIINKHNEQILKEITAYLEKNKDKKK